MRRIDYYYVVLANSLESSLFVIIGVFVELLREEVCLILIELVAGSDGEKRPLILIKLVIL